MIQEKTNTSTLENKAIFLVVLLTFIVSASLTDIHFLWKRLFSQVSLILSLININIFCLIYYLVIALTVTITCLNNWKRNELF